MSESQFFKCACTHCGQHFEVPVDSAGQIIECPACHQQTALTPPVPEPPRPAPSRLSIRKTADPHVEPAPAAAASLPPTQTVGSHVPSHLGSEKSWLLTLILNVLFGHLGIDRFYCGRIALGLLKLLTCGGGGIWPLVDALFLLNEKYKDDDGNALVPSSRRQKTIGTIVFVVWLLLNVLVVYSEFFQEMNDLGFESDDGQSF